MLAPTGCGAYWKSAAWTGSSMTDTIRTAAVLPTAESFGHNLRHTNRLIQRDLATRVALMGLNLGQWYALRALWERDGITQIELAQQSGIAGPAMVTAVRGLLAMGLVSRRRPSDDKRKYVISLTDKGWALQNQALEAAVDSNRLALQGIDPADIEISLRVLRAAHANLVAATTDDNDPAANEADRLVGEIRP